MKKDLSYLPQNKQDDLDKIVAFVREHCPAAGMIILFGSYARGDWREEKDLAPDRKSGHASDYDILIILKDENDCDNQARQNIEQASTSVGLSAMPRFIYHDINFVNRKLEQSQYFFSDIVDEGRLLFDKQAFKLATRRDLAPDERLRITEEDFSEWFESAEQFYEYYKIGMEKNWNKKAAFHLHQAAESAYKALLIVYTGYIPNEHYLAILSASVIDIDPVFKDIFPNQDKFQRDAFTSLEYAYIGARYDKRYKIDKQTLDYLGDRVKLLIRSTRFSCKEKLKGLQNS